MAAADNSGGGRRRGGHGGGEVEVQGVAFVETDTFAISPVTSLTQGLFCALFAFSGMRMHTHGCSRHMHMHMIAPDRAPQDHTALRPLPEFMTSLLLLSVKCARDRWCEYV